MKLKLLVLVTALFFAGRQALFAKVNFPSPQGFVNDFAQILTPEYETSLNQQLTDYNSQTSNEISVVTISSLGDMSVEEYAVELFQQWGIGKKGQDNGLLLLIAPSERQVRIEVGYGLEPFITDSRAGFILDTQFIPQFKNGNYEQGISNTVNEIQSYLQDSVSLPQPTQKNSQSTPIIEIILFFLLSGIPIYFLSYISRSKEIFTGGVVGILFGFLLSGLSFAIILGIFGFILDYLLSKNYKNLISAGKPTDFRSTFGGFRTGGGGGFGGFGGGRSGGGGASRGW